MEHTPIGEEQDLQTNQCAEEDYLTPFYSSADLWELLAEMRI